ncbi:ArsR/SmtB family transcription factor [Caldicellulosiruptoraceae bacterium PP1]
MSEERCSCNIIHYDIVEKVQKNIPDDEMLFELSEFFKVFADSTRIKILEALLVSEMCVCDIASILNVSQSAVSHQLRILKSARLVKSRKEGKVVYYSLNDEHVKGILDLGFVHINEK